MWQWLRQWWTNRRVETRQRVTVVMYTRAGCHLCDEAWEVLAKAGRKHQLDLTQVDVDGDSRLREEYGLEVPVVVINGKVRFRGRVNSVLLERLLRGNPVE